MRAWFSLGMGGGGLAKHDMEGKAKHNMKGGLVCTNFSEAVTVLLNSLGREVSGRTSKPCFAKMLLKTVWWTDEMHNLE